MSHRRKFNSSDLHKSIVRFTRKKQAMWCQEKITDNFITCRYARDPARFARRHFHNIFVKSLLQNSNRTEFFKYINKRIGKFAESSIALMNRTEIFNGCHAANLLNAEFRNKFNYIAKSATFAMAGISQII